MKKAHKRALAASSIALLCLSPLAACGGSGGSGGSANGSAHLTKADFADKVVAAMLKEKSAHMKLTTSGGMAAMNADGDFHYGGNDSAMKMTMGIGKEQIQMILADKTLYMQAPGMTPAGKWARIDKNSPGIGQMIGQELANMDPTAQIKTMKKGLKSVEYVGQKSVGGEKLNDYKVTVDPRAGLTGSSLPASGVPTTLTYDMYLDNDNLLRHLQMDVSGTHMVMDMDKWGEDVNVTVPKSADVVPFSMPSMPSMPSGQ